VSGLWALEQEDGTGCSAGGEDKVDDEGVTPRQVRGEEAAGDQTWGSASPSDRSVDGEGPAGLPIFGEGSGELREDGRGKQGGEDSLDGTRRHQHEEAGRRAADRRSSSQADQPDDKRRLATITSEMRSPRRRRLPKPSAQAVTIHCRSALEKRRAC
jgi:hypothetical protein